MKEIDAPLLVVPTENVADAASLRGIPVAVIVYELTATLATVNEPVSDPSDMEHVEEVTGVPVSEHP